MKHGGTEIKEAVDGLRLSSGPYALIHSLVIARWNMRGGRSSGWSLVDQARGVRLQTNANPVPVVEDLLEARPGWSAIGLSRDGF